MCIRDSYSLALEGPFNREASTCACSDKITSTGALYDPAVNVPQDITMIIAELINGDDVDLIEDDTKMAITECDKLVIAIGSTYTERLGW